MSLTPEQRHVLQTVKRVGRQMGASPKVMKAAIETIIVEANLQNPTSATDHDSLGAFQQRPSQGWGSPAQVTNVEHAARSFFQRAIPNRTKYGSAGELAQSVQRSAYPGRYDQAGSRAERLLGSAGARTGPVRQTGAVTGGSDLQAQARRQAAAQWLLSSSRSTADLQNRVARAEAAVPKVSPAAKPTVQRQSADTSASGVVNFEGHKVAAWIAPALAYARANGWKGQVNSGYRSFADQTRIYNSGVRPAAKPGTSNHEGSQYPRGAVDVTDPQGLARILRRSPYANKLVWAGGRDPVHFSHPHGGSY